MSLPASNAVRAAPAAICPACPRSCWISGRNGVVEAMAASTDKAPVTSVAQARPCARNNPEMAYCRRKLRTVDQGEAFPSVRASAARDWRGQRIKARYKPFRRQSA